jgi:hypothetical protein
MASTLVVQRLGHLNAYVSSYELALQLQRDVLGADVFREFDVAPAGSRNALGLIGRTCIETFAATTPDLTVGQWLAKHGPGWHSLEWTVPSMATAEETLAAHGIQVSVRAEDYLFTRPKDFHGICLELTEAHFDNDDRDLPGWEPTYWSDEHPLGIIGNAVIKVASSAPQQACQDLADLVGQPFYNVERSHLNSFGSGVRFADHTVEFVGSATGTSTDLVGAFVAEQGERIFCLTFQVADLSAARAYLAGSGLAFDQFGRHSLMLRPAWEQGTRIEFTDEV